MTNKGTFHASKDEGSITITGDGELNLYVAPELVRLLDEAAKSESDITVDLTNALYIDTAILAALITTGKKLLSSGHKLHVIVADNSQPQYVINIMGLDSLMDIRIASR